MYPFSQPSRAFSRLHMNPPPPLDEAQTLKIAENFNTIGNVLLLKATIFINRSDKTQYNACNQEMPAHRRPKYGEKRKFVTTGTAAVRYEVSSRQVALAKKLLRDSTPDVIAQVEIGELTLYAALPRYYDKYFKRQR